MTTPFQPNGMTYPQTAIIIAAPSTDVAADELRQYGIDLAASASYIEVATSPYDIGQLTVDQRRWAVAGHISPQMRQMMYVRFGEAVTMATLVAVANNNVVLRRKPWNAPNSP